MAKRSSLNPAWAEWSNKNMRGKPIWFEGEVWTVNTHIRNGVWRIVRFTETATVKLTRNGKVAAIQA